MKFAIAFLLSASTVLVSSSSPALVSSSLEPIPTLDEEGSEKALKKENVTTNAVPTLYNEGADSSADDTQPENALVPTLYEDGDGDGDAEPTLYEDNSSGDCIADDIIHRNGDSVGNIGLECIDSVNFDGIQSTCVDGEIVDTEMQFTCEGSVPYCVQCGPRKVGGALCLPTNTTDRDCGDGDAGGDDGSDGDEVTTTVIDSNDNLQDGVADDANTAPDALAKTEDPETEDPELLSTSGGSTGSFPTVALAGSVLGLLAFVLV